MFTQCPHCHAIYRLDAPTLAAAGGLVQCGQCEQKFNALASLRDDLPGASSDWENSELPFDLPEPVTDEARETAPLPTGETRHEAPDEPLAPHDKPAATLPGWPSTAPRASRFWLAASLALVAGLVAQILFLAPPAMAGHESLRPVARVLCRLSGCEVPPREALDRLRLASRDVRAHPSVPGALIISATLVNEAEFSQPYPVLEISLGDLQGNQVALRRFAPPTYLPESVDVDRGMAPDSRVQVSLEVVDPGQEAVAFRFAFRSARNG